jgi:hypothetical protein
MSRHQLIFTMSLGNSQKLILGNLRLSYPDGQNIDYLATSGLPDYQRPGDQWVRGKGPIPAGENYEIPAEPYWLALFCHSRGSISSDTPQKHCQSYGRAS